MSVDKTPIPNDPDDVELTAALAQQTAPCLLPIYRFVTNAKADLAGTGLFVRIGRGEYLLTAGHVFEEFPECAIFGGNGRPLLPLVNRKASYGDDIDVGISRLDFGSLGRIQGKAAVDWSAVAIRSFGPQYAFIQGFPEGGTIPAPWRNAVSSQPIHRPYRKLVQGPVVWPNYNPDVHILLDYPAQQADENGVALPFINPHGLSGTPVWTIWKDTYHGDDSPRLGLIGIVHRWDEVNEKLIATRIEHILVQIREFLHQEVAYFHWLARAGPPDDDWTDWFSTAPPI